MAKSTTGNGSRAAIQIDESLKRLQTDHVDLLQFREVIRFDDQFDTVQNANQRNGRERDQTTALLYKTAQAAARGEYELFKTSSHFDSTAEHPQWLGKESSRVATLGKSS